jgi:glycosyltransferase involved in cell wall biosynthesis
MRKQMSSLIVSRDAPSGRPRQLARGFGVSSIKSSASEATHASQPAAGRTDLACWLYVMNWELRYPGGVNEVVRNLFDRTQQHLAHTPLVLVRSWQQRAPYVSEHDGRRTVSASWPAPWGSPRPLRTLTSFLARLPRALVHLRRLVIRERVATVHVNYTNLDALIWPIVARTVPRKPRLILSFHGLDLQSALAARGAERLAWRILLRATDHVVVCTESLRSALVASFPSSAPKTSVVRNGVDSAHLARIAAPPPQHPIPAPYIFSAGTYEAKKGLDILLRAFETIADDFPALSLVIAGRYEKTHFDLVEAQRNASPYASRIHLFKDLSHDETMRLLARAACFVLASRQEPFGIALLEAGALRVPAVASAACGALEYLRESEEVRVAATGDPAALAQQIKGVLLHSDDSKQMAARMHATVTSNLEWSRIIVAFEQLGRDPAARSAPRERESDTTRAAS